MSENTLTAVFEAHKDELADKLSSYSLPQDEENLRKTIISFLSDILNNEGDYRQSLTQSENYILQAALNLSDPAQSIKSEIAFMTEKNNNSNNKVSEIPSSPYTPLLGTGIGGLAGGFISTPWVAICAAIAGTAIIIYCRTNTKKAKKDTGRKNKKTKESHINPGVFVNVLKKICESIDNLMETYRVQVKKIQTHYERQNEQTLLNAYPELIEKVANVITVVNANSASANDGILTAVDMLSNSLENYDLKYENGKIVKDK